MRGGHDNNTVDPRLSIRITEYSDKFFNGRSNFYLMHTTSAMNIINLVVWIIEGSDK